MFTVIASFFFVLDAKSFAPIEDQVILLESYLCTYVVSSTTYFPFADTHIFLVLKESSDSSDASASKNDIQEFAVI